jgi:hypothetical protein
MFGDSPRQAREEASDLRPLPQKEQDLFAYVSTGSGLDQEIGEVSIIRRNDDAPVMPVPVQQLSGEKQGRSLVGFSEGLGSGDPVDQHSCGLHGILDGCDRAQGRTEPLQVVGLVEPLVILPHRLIDGDGQLEAGANQ